MVKNHVAVLLRAMVIGTGLTLAACAPGAGASSGTGGTSASGGAVGSGGGQASGGSSATGGAGASCANGTACGGDLVGTWTLVSADAYGPNPKGTLMFDANGHFPHNL